ncbi:hypothetical protein B0H34DRAFT_398472 [Crassisporium funariophilum]|nr:hypothetical protein B0H34DRAFT_398472 [Crassisporium funariophilum]
MRSALHHRTFQRGGSMDFLMLSRIDLRNLTVQSAIDRLESDLKLAKLHYNNHAHGRKYDPRVCHQKLAPGPSEAWWKRPIKVRVNGFEYERVISKVPRSSAARTLNLINLVGPFSAICDAKQDERILHLLFHGERRHTLLDNHTRHDISSGVSFGLFAMLGNNFSVVFTIISRRSGCS